MSIELTAAKNVFIPDFVQVDGNGTEWLRFSYSNEDKVLPYRWPKVLKFQNRLFQWMSYNSDSMTIHYRETDPEMIATTYTQKAR